ncbi:MAG: ABC transporter substrate-binding protein [Spirochaetales bacterium]|nr:ABC transporter substrate-binding protein [Spirochaetales bacterium]
MSRIPRLAVLLLAAVGAGALAGCVRAPAPDQERTQGRPREGVPGQGSLTIAEQYGLAYAPLQVLRKQGLLERALPGVRVHWQQLANTATIREAMVAGRVDVGFVAIPPFLIGRDNGMDWRIFTGLSEAPLALVCWKPGIRSLSDFGPGDRIALPQPASVQHILLAMAAQRELGDARRFDRQIVTMAHPDAMTALLARGDVTAHFSSPPYLGRELADPGVHVVLTGAEAMGEEFTFIVGVASAEVLARRGAEIGLLSRALAEASSFLARRPAEAAALLSPLYGLPAVEIAAALGSGGPAPTGASSGGLRFGPEIRGLSRFAEFMYREGFLNRPADPVDRLLWSGYPAEGTAPEGGQPKGPGGAGAGGRAP